MPRYVVNRTLRYPVDPDLPREEWQWKNVPAGSVVDDIPAKSLPWLLDQEHIAELETPERAQLPEDFPAREILVSHGITTLKQVEARWDTLAELEGIGPKTLEKIGQALAAAAEGEGG